MGGDMNTDIQAGAGTVAVRETRSVCPYCGTGCGVLIQHDGQRMLGVRGDPDHPANFGRLCTKGRTLHQTVQGSDRATHPLWRDWDSGSSSPLPWSEALHRAAEGFAGIIRAHGPQAVAFYVSGQLPTEDYYVANKLAKGFIGTNHIDTNSRLCMASAVAGYKSSLGMDSVPCAYEDIDLADCIFLIGSNTAYAHPIVFRRIEDAKAGNPNLRIIVADPRRTPTASIADLYLPLKPGTDVALLHGILHILIWEGWIDRAFIDAHTEGWEALKALVQDYNPQTVAETCAIAVADLRRAAELFGTARAALSLWCQGLNQSAHGTDKNTALINLHLATGQIGKPGAGPFSLTGQPNAMGGREVGSMPALLPGHRDVLNPAHREEIARFWGVEGICPEPGLTAVPLFQAMERGEIKAVWIVCTNPVLSMPDQAQVIRALARAELVILQDAYLETETGAYADLLLPATSWGEREAVVTNSERRISHLGQAIPAPGAALPDWEIFRDFAYALGAALDESGQPAPATMDSSWTARAQRLFAFSTAESVFNEYRETTRGRDLDITGLSFACLDRDGPQQWPFPEGAGKGSARLYGDGIFPTPSGRARFRAPAYAPVVEDIDARYPLRLITGRLRDQWHSMSRTGKVTALFQHSEEPLLEIHPRDAQRLGLKDGQLCRVSSRRGKVVVRAQVLATASPGVLFLPMHFGTRFAPAGECNRLTLPAIDPVSGEPEFKHTAVRVEPLAFAWTGAILALLDDEAQFLAARAMAQGFPYASLARIGGATQNGFLLRLAAEEAPPAWAVREWDRALGIGGADALDYQDLRRGVSKRICVRAGHLVAARLFGETETLDWLRELLLAGTNIQPYRHALFAPTVPQQLGAQAPSHTVCTCRGVRETVICAAIAQGAKSVEAVAQACGAGSECGSCRPEISALLRAPVQEAS